MRLDSVFRTSVYLLTALAGAMLAYAEDGFFPSGVTVVLSCVANLLLSDAWPRSCTSPRSSAIFWDWSCWESFIGSLAEIGRRRRAGGRDPFSRIYHVGRAFQARDVRHYWWLCALSLLQVAVGPLLTLSSGLYGILLLLYVLLAIWTLSVFTLYQRLSRLEISPKDRPGRGFCVRGDAGKQWKLAANWRSAARPSLGQWRPSTGRHPSNARLPPIDAAPSKPLFSRIPPGDGSLPGSSSAHYPWRSPDRPWEWVCFSMFPVSISGQATRIGMNHGDRGNPVTGFSDEIRLGQLQQILESTERVMHVGLFDHQTDDPLSIDGFAAKRGLLAPLFRGSVLDLYGKGRWTVEPRAELSSDLDSWPRGPGIIRQEYTLELHKSDILFAMHTLELAVVIPYQREQRVNIDPDSDVLFLSNKGRDVVRYVVYSNGKETSSAPHGKGRSRALQYRENVVTSVVLMRCRKLPRQGKPSQLIAAPLRT